MHEALDSIEDGTLYHVCIADYSDSRLHCYLRTSRVYKTRDDEPVGWSKYCSLPIICPSNFHYFESEEGGALCLNIWLALTICPHKCIDVGRSNTNHDNLL